MFSKKNLSMIIVSVFCLISLAGAEEGKSESKIELIPVYEKTFDDTIVDVIFDTTTVSIEEAKRMGWKEEAFSKNELTKGKAAILFAKVVITQHEVAFYDCRGNLKNQIPINYFDWLRVSPNGHFILIRELSIAHRDISVIEKCHSFFYDWDGNLLWERLGIGKGWRTYPTDVGYLVEYLEEEGLWWGIKIYNSAGRFIKEFTPEMLPPTTEAGRISFQQTSDGRYWIAQGDKWDKGSSLWIWDEYFNKLWTIQSKREYFSLVPVASNSQGFVVYVNVPSIENGIWSFDESQKYLVFYNWTGKEVWRYRFKAPAAIMDMRIFDNGGKLATLAWTGSVRVMDIKSGKCLWEYKPRLHYLLLERKGKPNLEIPVISETDSTRPYFRSLAICENFNTIGITGTIHNYSMEKILGNKLLVFSHNGKVLVDKNIDTPFFIENIYNMRLGGRESKKIKFYAIAGGEQ